MVKFLLVVLFLALAGGPVLAGNSGDENMEQFGTEVQLSLDQNSRDLMAVALGQAQVSVRAVVYKFDDPQLMPMLQNVLDRGIQLQVLCDEKQSKKDDSLISNLAAAGATIRTWPRQQGKLHAKFVICDEDRVLSGSWNWTRSAGQNNLELLLDIKEKDTVKRFEELFVQLWKMGRPIAAVK